MLVEYFRKRTAKIPNTIYFYSGKGRSLTLTLNKPVEVPDQEAYSILADNGDIIREAAALPVPVPVKRKRTKKPKIYADQKVEVTEKVADEAIDPDDLVDAAFIEPEPETFVETTENEEV